MGCVLCFVGQGKHKSVAHRRTDVPAHRRTDVLARSAGAALGGQHLLASVQQRAMYMAAEMACALAAPWTDKKVNELCLEFCFALLCAGAAGAGQSKAKQSSKQSS